MAASSTIKNILRSIVAIFGFRLSRRGVVPIFSRVFSPKFDKKVFALLPSELQEMVDWPREQLEEEHNLTSTKSGSIWKGIPGGHKWLDYFLIYDREFSVLRGKQSRVLEIGVYKGASLKMWREYFGSACTIVGIDIDEDCRKFDDPSNDIHVRIGSQADGIFLRDVIQEFGPFDLIMDDGSHVASHQIASFNALFLDGLGKNGIYYIEDLEGNYWGDVSGQLDQEISTMDFLKMVIDMPNFVFKGNQYEDFFINDERLKDSFVVPRISTLIESVKFYRGVAIIQKQHMSPPYGYHM